MKVNDLRDIIMYIVRVNQDKEVNMNNTRNYKVKGKKMLPKSYNRTRNQAKKLGRRFTRLENLLRTRMRNLSRGSGCLHLMEINRGG